MNGRDATLTYISAAVFGWSIGCILGGVLTTCIECPKDGTKFKASGGSSKPSNADLTLFLQLKTSEFVLKCMHNVAAEATPEDYLIVKELFVPFTNAIERAWADLIINVVSSRPGFWRLSTIDHLISDFIGPKPEFRTSLWWVLRKTVDALPKDFVLKIHRYLSGLRITMDNSCGACLLLYRYNQIDSVDSLDKSVFHSVALGFIADPKNMWHYFVAARHILKHPLAAAAFPSLSQDIFTCLVRKYGHPQSWYSYQPSLLRMQTESQWRTLKAHDEMLLMLNHLEFEGGVKILPSHIDRTADNFLLDPVVLTFLRTHFVDVDIARRDALVRSSVRSTLEASS